MKNKITGLLTSPKAVPYYFTAPLIAATGLLVLFPAFGTFFTSLFRDVGFLDKKFIFFENYVSIFSDSGFLQSLKFTLLFTLVSVPLEIAAGVLLAALLNEALPGRGFLRVAVLIPWAIPVAVSGRIWELIFSYSHGIMNSILLKTGMAAAPVNWLGSGESAFLALLIADAWKTIPFVGIIVLAGLQSVPGELYEQAKTDGAGIFRRFFSITLPVIKPVIVIALLFRTIDALRIFDLIFVLTGGGPGGDTSSLTLFAYEYFLAGDFGAGSAVSVVLFIMALTFSVFYLKAGKFGENMK